MKPTEYGPRCTSCGARGAWLCERCRVEIEGPEAEHPELKRGTTVGGEEC